MFPSKDDFKNLTKDETIILSEKIAKIYLLKNYYEIIDSREIVNFYDIDLYEANFDNDNIAAYTKNNKIVTNKNLSGKEYNFVILKELYQNLSNNWNLDSYNVSERCYKLKTNADYFSAFCIMYDSKKYFDIATNFEISNATLIPEEIVSIFRYKGDAL